MDQRRPDLLTWHVGSEALLFDLTALRAHWLNSTAGFIWGRLDQRAVSIAEEISWAYEIPEGEALAAVEATERNFKSLNLLGRPKPSPPSSPVSTPGPRFEPVPPNT